MQFKTLATKWLKKNPAVTCFWCGGVLNLAGATDRGEQPTREHVKPRSKGGKGGGYNLRLACALCNNTRGSDTSWVPFHELARALATPGAVPVQQRAILRAKGVLSSVLD